MERRTETKLCRQPTTRSKGTSKNGSLDLAATTRKQSRSGGSDRSRSVHARVSPRLAQSVRFGLLSYRLPRSCCRCSVTRYRRQSSGIHAQTGDRGAIAWRDTRSLLRSCEFAADRNLDEGVRHSPAAG